MMATVRSLSESISRGLFGRDIFISYARRDAVGYARQLAVAIAAQRRVSICIDQWAAPPFATTHPALLRELKRSSLLVLVASESAVASTNVADELIQFGRTGRNIVPIDVAGALRTVSWPAEAFEAIRGTVSEAENLAALASAEPSTSVVARIVAAIDFETQTQRIHNFAYGTALGVLVMVIGAILISAWRVEKANQLVTSAEIKASDAGDRADLARQKEADARRQEAMARKAAEREAERAAEEARKAEAERLRAGEAAAEAGRQQEFAQALRWANESTTVFRQQPDEVVRATLLAVVAAKRSARLSMGTLATLTALRDTVSMLPVVEQSAEIPGVDFGTQALSGDGRYLAVIRDDSAVELCAALLGSCARLDGPSQSSEESFHELLFSPDSSAVAATFESGNGGVTAFVWSTETGRIRGTPIELEDEPSAISLAPDGAWLAVGTDQGVVIYRIGNRSDLAQTILDPEILPAGWSSTAAPLLLTIGRDARLWAPENAEPVTILATKSPPNDAAVSGDGSLIATTDEAQGLAVWDRRRSVQQPLWSLQATTALSYPKFSPDGLLIATSAVDEGVRVFDSATGRVIGHFEGGDDFAFNSNGSRLLTSMLGIARLWRLPDGHELARHQAFAQPLVAFLDDGRSVSGEAGGSLSIWQSNPATSPESPLDLAGRVVATSPIPGSEDLLVATFTRSPPSTTISRVSVEGVPRPCFTATGKVKAFAMDDSGSVLTGNEEGRIQTWVGACSDSPRLDQEFTTGRPVSAIVFQGPTLALATGEHTIFTRLGVTQMLPHPTAVRSMALSSDGKTLFTGADDGVRVWDVSSSPPRASRSLSARRGANHLVLDPSGRFLAVAGPLSGVEVFDLRRRSNVPVSVILPDWINTVVGFDPSGRYLVTGGADRLLYLWIGWEVGAPQAVFRQKLASEIRGAGFSADGRQMVVLAGDRHPTYLRTLWRQGDLLHIACELAGRSFSQQEWRSALPGIDYEAPCR